MNSPAINTWTPERVEELKKLWFNGVPTVDIGTMLNVTKNSVVGKVHRLGLPKRQVSSKASNSERESPPIKVVATPRKKPTPKVGETKEEKEPEKENDQLELQIPVSEKPKPKAKVKAVEKVEKVKPVNKVKDPVEKPKKAPKPVPAPVVAKVKDDAHSKADSSANFKEQKSSESADPPVAIPKMQKKKSFAESKNIHSKRMDNLPPREEDKVEAKPREKSKVKVKIDVVAYKKTHKAGQGKHTGIQLADIKSSQCHWPIGDPDELEFHFCGDSALSDSPYCKTHMEEAYQKSTK